MLQSLRCLLAVRGSPPLTPFAILARGMRGGRELSIDHNENFSYFRLLNRLALRGSEILLYRCSFGRSPRRLEEVAPCRGFGVECQLFCIAGLSLQRKATCIQHHALATTGARGDRRARYPSGLNTRELGLCGKTQRPAP